MIGKTRSKTRSISWLLVAIAAVLTISAQAALAGNPGSAGMLSLRFPVGTREAAMGDAGVAASRGAGAVFWNPANNVFEDFETALVVQHYRYLGAFNQEAAAVAHRVGDGVLGLVFAGFYSDEIQRSTGEPVGVYEGEFKPYDVAFGISYAHPLGKRFAVGANAKIVYERIDIYSDAGTAYDLFVSHQALIEGLRFAASLTNLGSQMNLNIQPFDLPTAYRIGAAYEPVRGFLKDRTTFAAELFVPQDTNAKAHLGAEYRLVSAFALRAGYKINYDTQGMTAGFGVRLAEGFELDYAYQEMTESGLDDGHKFALNMVW